MVSSRLVFFQGRSVAARVDRRRYHGLPAPAAGDFGPHRAPRRGDPTHPPLGAPWSLDAGKDSSPSAGGRSPCLRILEGDWGSKPGMWWPSRREPGRSCCGVDVYTDAELSRWNKEDELDEAERSRIMKQLRKRRRW